MNPLEGKPPEFSRKGAQERATVYAYGVNFPGDGFGKHGNAEPYPTADLARAVAAYWFKEHGVVAKAEPVAWSADLDEIIDWHYRWGLDAAAAGLVDQALQ